MSRNYWLRLLVSVPAALIVQQVLRPVIEAMRGLIGRDGTQLCT
jgi:hypothetical protein